MNLTYRVTTYDQHGRPVIHHRIQAPSSVRAVEVAVGRRHGVERFGKRRPVVTVEQFDHARGYRSGTYLVTFPGFEPLATGTYAVSLGESLS